VSVAPAAGEPATVVGTTAITSRSVEANGYRIHLLEAGSGPLVLMLHGFPEIAYSWRHQIAALAAAGYHAVAIDMLGYGRSSKPSTVETRITAQVRTLAGVVAAVGHETAVVIGHDVGSPVAWCAAWTRPDLFDAVVGVSVPFGGRGLFAWPGDSFGAIRPSEYEARIAGPGKLHYQEYFSQPGALAREVEKDLRGWLNGLYYGTSAAAPLPKFSEIKNQDEALAFVRETAIVMAPGEGFSDKLPTPGDDHWLAAADLEVYVANFESTGIEAALNSYRTLDLDWELLEPYADRPLDVPALFIAGEKDLPALWGVDAIGRMPEVAPQAHEPVLLEGCGHWNFQEDPAMFNAALLGFLGAVKPVG
jgi:pimeloyl-ACP methyl ester carboxylesterase